MAIFVSNYTSLPRVVATSGGDDDARLAMLSAMLLSNFLCRKLFIEHK